MLLKNKVALVTGSSRGIGKAIDLKLAKEGAKVVVNCLKTKDRGLEVVKEIESLGSETTLIQCDISKEEEVKKMFSKIIEKFNRIDILVNNAGIVFDVPFFEKTSKQWKETIDINLMGVVFCSKEAALQMKKQENKCSIINISSTNGINCFHPSSIDYDITKAGVNLLTKDLAIEFAPNIRVNAIAPGWVNTEMNLELPKEFLQKEKDKIYLKRFAEPEEIANVVYFLATEESSFINGSIIKVDGGYN